MFEVVAEVRESVDRVRADVAGVYVDVVVSVVGIDVLAGETVVIGLHLADFFPGQYADGGDGFGEDPVASLVFATVVCLRRSFGFAFEPDTGFAGLEGFGEMRGDRLEATVPAASLGVVHGAWGKPLSRPSVAISFTIFVSSQRLE